MNWQDKAEVKKGNIGEQIINEYLESKGFVIYKPITNGAHAFDKLAIKDKQQLIIAEVKTKARRNKYADTGIDMKHFETYQNISKKHNLPIFIFFVDEMLGEVYGNWLTKLIEPRDNYPLIQNDIIYFPLTNMRNIKKLTIQEVELLKKYSKRNYKYSIK